MPAELSKAEDGEWRVRGLASTASRDQQGEIMLQDGMDLTPIDKKKGILNWDHKKGPENTLGVLDGYTRSPEGLYIEGRLFKNHDKAKAAYQIMSSLGKSDYGRMGLSVEGSIKERAGKDGQIIKRSVITGVALTMNPVNSDTYVDLTKSMTSDETDFEINSSEEASAISGSGSEPDSASSEAQSPLFTSEQVLELMTKALAVGGEQATTTPSERSGGAALAQEDLDKKKAKKAYKSEENEDDIEKGRGKDLKPRKHKGELNHRVMSDSEKQESEKLRGEFVAHMDKYKDYKRNPDHPHHADYAADSAKNSARAKRLDEIHYGIKKGSSEWFQKSITDAVDSLKMLYPDIPTDQLLKALEDRLNTKYGIKDSN